MTLGAIYAHLDALSPFALQESWDNSGLQVGQRDREITQVVLSIDIDAALLEQVPKGSLIITHHPLIFGGLKSLNFDTYPSIYLRTMVEKELSLIAMHTNFDQTHLNRYVAEQILGLRVEEQAGYVAYMQADMPFAQLAGLVQERLGLNFYKAVACHEHVGRVALVTGSGASMLAQINADCLLTGDIKYHDAMEAKALGRSMIDIGHYESERYFGEVLAPHLENLGFEVIIAPSKNPFVYA